MGLGGSKTELISGEELKLVESSWKVLMENPEENGICIFSTFLKRHNYYSKFQKFKDIPISELENNRVFKKHAASIIQAINNVILHLNNESLLKNDLIALGKMHGNRNVNEKEFVELQTVILDILEKEFKLPEEGLKAWKKTLDIAFVHVFEGLRREH